MNRQVVLAFVFSVGTVAASQSDPVLQLKITPERELYTLNEPVLIRAELTNISKKTVCFPAPSQRCKFAPTGSLITTGEPVSSETGRYFVCQVDGRGKSGRELEEAIRNDWIRLEPGATFTAKPAKAQLKLDEPGEWNVKATYDAPEGAFSQEYKKELQVAAERAGCTLPEGTVSAEPIKIKVIEAAPK